MANKQVYTELEVYGKISSSSVEIIGEYTLPLQDGVQNQILVTDGLGQLNFVNLSTIGLTNTNILNGTGISWSYNSINNTITPTVTLAPFSTTNLAEGTNLYFTNQRVTDRVSTSLQPGLAGTGSNSITWNYVSGLGTLTPTVSLTPFSTTNLSEGTNLYFTNERVDDRVADLIQNSATITWTYDDVLNTLVADASPQSITVNSNSVTIGSQNIINFIEGSNIQLIVTEDSINGKIDIQIDSTATLPSGIIIEDTGSGSTMRKDNYNQASGDYSTVSGGSYNQASVAYSTIGGGCCNISSGVGSSIGGGGDNTASGGGSSIGGGRCNTSSGGGS